MSKDHQIFQGFLRGRNLTDAERKEAWRTLNDYGIVVAKGYVESVLAQKQSNIRVNSVPKEYAVYGESGIEPGALQQMNNAMRLPIAVAGALMADAHQGYGLPIGGVLATDNAVVPYAIGVDIACRMRVSVFPIEPEALKRDQALFEEALLKNTIFGAGAAGLNDGTIDHAVLDEWLWSATPLLKSLRETAIRQIGTSGGGNHFADFCDLFPVWEDSLGIPDGKYVALMTHSGSRGVGFKIANTYTEIAKKRCVGLPKEMENLAWLDMDNEEGQEYWYAMNLAGLFAAANHQIIHDRIAAALGVEPILKIENHHNFAWSENVVVDGESKSCIVHRKGATPAGVGVRGVIPGSMGDVGYLVQGRGNDESLNSAPHGAGRMMSRTQAIKTIAQVDTDEYLRIQGVLKVIGGGKDESPFAYKEIGKVMRASEDLVDKIGVLYPRIVRMADDTLSAPRDESVKGIVLDEGS